mmetsp:Transcript_51346/g.166471  ORF Transcript_51346/g.166471 Transcript_51346/m.166471 type:complete len:404 (+) Transcript_51346:98-1309(+)
MPETMESVEQTSACSSSASGQIDQQERNQETAASLLQSAEWHSFLRAARHDAPKLQKLRRGAMSSWVARHHSAPWFPRLRAAGMALPHEEVVKLGDVAKKKGGLIVERILWLTWHVSDMRIAAEKLANEVESHYGFDMSLTDKIAARQETVGFTSKLTALFTCVLVFYIGVTSWNIDMTWMAVVSCLLFFGHELTFRPKLGDVLEPLAKYQRQCVLDKNRHVSREVRREKEQEFTWAAKRAERQRDRRRTVSSQAFECSIGRSAPASIECHVSSPAVMLTASPTLSASSGAEEDVGPGADLPPPVLEADAGAELDSDEDGGLCVCCSENEAMFVLDQCGHLVFCRACRRKLIYRMRCLAGLFKPDRHELTTRELSRTRMPCPLCRREGIAVEKQGFDGTVFCT